MGEEETDILKRMCGSSLHPWLKLTCERNQGKLRQGAKSNTMLNVVLTRIFQFSGIKR